MSAYEKIGKVIGNSSLTFCLSFDYLYIGIILSCDFNIAYPEADFKMGNCMKCIVKTCAKHRNRAKCTIAG